MKALPFAGHRLLPLLLLLLLLLLLNEPLASMTFSPIQVQTPAVQTVLLWPVRRVRIHAAQSNSVIPTHFG
jgi:hypothetical protein